MINNTSLHTDAHSSLFMNEWEAPCRLRLTCPWPENKVIQLARSCMFITECHGDARSCKTGQISRRLISNTFLIYEP